MSKYSDLLKDPRWQKKRLEILNLDAWQCRRCNSKSKTLHVHHLYYEKGNDPWDYPDSALVTLCVDCHEAAPSINWQQAFYDLNMTEFDLLDLSALIRFRKQKFEEQMKASNSTIKYRPLYAYMWYDLFESQEEVDEFFRSRFGESHKQEYVG